MNDIRLAVMMMLVVPGTLAAQSSVVTIRAGRLLDGQGIVMQNATVATDNAQLWSAIADAKLRLPFTLAAIGRSAPSVYAVGGAGIN